jgi:hypothetical protein
MMTMSPSERTAAIDAMLADPEVEQMCDSDMAVHDVDLEDHLLAVMGEDDRFAVELSHWLFAPERAVQPVHMKACICGCGARMLAE